MVAFVDDGGNRAEHEKTIAASYHRLVAGLAGAGRRACSSMRPGGGMDRGQAL
jgi:hypothetical protein